MAGGQSSSKAVQPQPFTAWSAGDVMTSCSGCSKSFRVSVDETTVGRELKALSFAKLSARPRHLRLERIRGF